MKNINFEKLEILSPAGNPENFMSALNAGADAIYLGLDMFNARMKAENFTRNNIREYIKLAHSFKVKVYITINTLLQDKDFDKLVSLVDFLTQAKADAFIVQDLGVAYTLRKCFKNINLHASTQMGIHNLEGALVAEKLGFSRIVLSRETSLADIEDIHKNTNLEIEYFIQGALCVAFSGNCYLSSIENNASGNEGKCLQLCRLPYQNNLTNESKYYLSPRDLSLLENLPKLINAGVTSFKIEGRMKHSGYVSICTNLYKNALNSIKNNIFDIKFIDNTNEILKKTFSRGNFNKNAYLTKNNENNIINSTFQNHIGIKIGKIEKISTFKDDLFNIIIKSNHPISNGDGLKFIDSSNNQIASLGVGSVENISNNLYSIITKYKLKPNLNVYLIQDSNLEKQFLKNIRKIPINLNISALKCNKLKIDFQFNNLKYNYESNEILQPVKNSPLSTDEIKTQISKVGDNIFEITDIKIKTDGIFAPKSLLNKIRRDAFEKLQNYIITQNEKNLNIEFLAEEYNKQKMQNPNITPKNYAIFSENTENIAEFTKNQINIIAPNNYIDFSNNIKTIVQKNITLFLPVITNFEDKIIINKIVNNSSIKSLFINNIGGLYYKIYQNKEVIVSPLLNIKNKFALLQLNELGITNICASIEANIDFANKYNLSVFNEGYFPLMTFAHCPYKAVYNSSCTNCKFNNNLTYKSQSNKTYKIDRTKISNCYFYLMKPLSIKNCKYFLKNLKNN